ncbi:hypothetical protein ANANG_G00025510 [Anguilla anguilla]|uniref:LIM zinc-binding domain-containing protein n=1 Tax=Anguilla anguilla TaxID=7936 RepID=A0A9D3N0D2_ANGAN|nr:hypothetical protein ANANG_G00025510 [Anguilla anguilla]
MSGDGARNGKGCFSKVATEEQTKVSDVSPVSGRGEQNNMSERFDCDNCKESLYGRKYIQSEDSPYCIPCYDSLFANTCDECKELIGHDSRELFYEDRHYHEHCFRCFRCDRSLADEPFTSQEEALLCNDCYCNEFSSKCVACDKTVMPEPTGPPVTGRAVYNQALRPQVLYELPERGTRRRRFIFRALRGSREELWRVLQPGVFWKGKPHTEAGVWGSTWHETCFICHSCEQPIGSKSFIPDKDEHYCVPCYENKFSAHPSCTRCKQVLTKGGVTYREEPWHKECFVCTGCKVQLAGQHFTSREDSPYCLKCFGSLYAKKCEACSKPITGFGGKYISFEERQWHQPCFACSRCSVSLVGAGFFPAQDEILCRECNSSL